ncbi:hypothetical protein [Vibrio tapetis]|uniref:Lipoprotein n=1 Tax=Vibrio tapetis subsp. tapetis TaxID=1671868 RepID=A0A2N8ZJ04_9VIBR|nr:hypothetical protein [Vibrio tapetis]SON51889.1 exported protein of unknown function [Vibrio tapetis subsp. tapetis]
MIQITRIKHTLVTLAAITLLAGCSGKPITGTEAVLVPVKAELKLGYKSTKQVEKNKLEQKARDFVVSQFEQDAERIVIVAHTKAGKQLQAKLKSDLGKYQQWIEYQQQDNGKATSDIVLTSHRTQVIMPPCPQLSSSNTWSMQDGCFVDRARQKSLATPSTLTPVVSELSIYDQEGL